MSPLAIPCVLALALAHDPVPPQGGERGVFTSRTSPVELPLPSEEDAFSFAVFGDRTGGPAEGVRVLAQAVEDVNLLGPDLVMTVGDLIQGYDVQEPWMRQMREFRGIMDGLDMPWFPVAGNHDVYWRGPGRPELEHETNYEAHFGPLWYAFRHKTAWFLVLYTDEGNPETGVRTFNDPDSQRMSPEQLDWLAETLERAADSQHIFVFLHHPRWLGGNYGEDWERVHGLLADAGNVTAVFAGHIHRMRYDGVRDGIEYFTLATVGGHQNGHAPRAGYLHHYDIVTVRPGGITLSALPVGAALDPRAVTGEVSDDAQRVAQMNPEVRVAGELSFGRRAQLEVDLVIRNPARRAIELEATPALADPRWFARPDHLHTTVGAGEERTLTFALTRSAAPLDAAFRLPRIDLAVDLLTEGARIHMPQRSLDLSLKPSTLPAPAQPRGEHALALDGKEAWAEVESAELSLPDGPFTLEAWFRAERVSGRIGLITKTENSEFGLFLSNGNAPAFLVHLDGAYAEAQPERQSIEVGRWTHMAGVFDGERVSLYIDGGLVASEEASGRRAPNRLPLIVGGDVAGGGGGTSLFQGDLDEVRLSVGARYSGSSFRPMRRFLRDDRTQLLLHMDANSGPWLYDASGGERHATRRGGAAVLEVDR